MAQSPVTTASRWPTALILRLNDLENAQGFRTGQLRAIRSVFSHARETHMFLRLWLSGRPTATGDLIFPESISSRVHSPPLAGQAPGKGDGSAFPPVNADDRIHTETMEYLRRVVETTREPR